MIVLDVEQQTVTRTGMSPVVLPRRLCKLMAALVGYGERFLSDAKIKTALWGNRPPADVVNNIKTAICVLRLKLRPIGVRILNRREVGYRLEVPEGVPFPVIGDQPN